MLNIVKVSFTFPESTFNLLREVIPTRKRSSFVADTIERELRKQALYKAAKKSAGILKDKDYPYWNSKKNITRWINKRRSIDTKRLKNLWK